MAKKKGFYDVYTHSDNLEPGNELKIEHYIRVHDNIERLKTLINIPQGDLEKMREKNVAAEQAVFDRLCGEADEWTEIAANTTMMDRALEYLKVPQADHSSNEWSEDNYGYKFRSNTVYKMSYHVYVDTSYDRRTQTHITNAWYLTWRIDVGGPPSGVYCGQRVSGFHKIAGQDRKRFTDKAAMEKYLGGRIDAYAHLFTEESPPIPKEYAMYFKKHGVLLPGYTVEDENVKTTDKTKDAASVKPSVLKSLAENDWKAKSPAKEASKRNVPAHER
jgi:hypothetical protein